MADESKSVHFQVHCAPTSNVTCREALWQFAASAKATISLKAYVFLVLVVISSVKVLPPFLLPSLYLVCYCV